MLQQDATLDTRSKISHRRSRVLQQAREARRSTPLDNRPRDTRPETCEPAEPSESLQSVTERNDGVLRGESYQKQQERIGGPRGVRRLR